MYLALHSWNPIKVMEKLFLQRKTQSYKDERGKDIDKIWKLAEGKAKEQLNLC